MGAARTHAISGNTGDLRDMQDSLRSIEEIDDSQESEGPILLTKSVNTDGGKGPWFRVRFGKLRMWRST